MTNKEWLATLPKETWWEVVYEWLLHEYGMAWNNSRLAIMDWLEEPHIPIMKWDVRTQTYITRWK